MTQPTLSLRRRPLVKPPPPGVELAEGSARNDNLRLDDIVARTREAKTRHERRQMDSLEKREAVLAKAEVRMAEHEHALREREAAVQVREREAFETIKLAEVREAQAARREALLADNRDALKQADAFARVQAELAAQQRDNIRLTSSLEESRRQVDALESKLDEARKKLTEIAVLHEAEAERATLDPEQEQMLRDREAFIEESENALFHRAQDLQEQEVYLQQWQDELTALAKKLGAPESMPAALAEEPDEDTKVPAEPIEG